MVWNYSKLDASTLSRVQAAEAELGVTLLAVRSEDIPAVDLNDAQVKRLKEYEDELGLVLVGVNTK